jgi:hypothetical protein
MAGREERIVMSIRNSLNSSVFLALLVAAAPARADDIRPDSDARPFADEVCLERCDTESDQCMQDSEGDPRKTQACDDEYSECLKSCEAG